MTPGLKLNSQGSITGIAHSSSGSFTITTNQFSIRNSSGKVVFRMGLFGSTARETMEANRAKDQAAPWWKRITG